MSDRPEQELVSREEHERLRQDFAALQEQFEAADSVLSAIGRSAGDPETVLSAIVESARGLCRSQAAYLCLLEDGYYRLIQSVGISEESIRFITDHPMAVDRDTLIGRVGLERRTQQIPDVFDDPDYGAFDLQRIAGYRTTMGAPMLLDDEVVGALVVWRNEVSPFDEREMAIVTAFAGQAAMAVNGVKLVQQLEARGAELATRVDELEALRAVGEAVSSSLDVDRVLSTIACTPSSSPAPTEARSWSTPSGTGRSGSAASIARSPRWWSAFTPSGSTSTRRSSDGRRSSGVRSRSPT
jgi:GAF domain-containing protein